MNLSLIDPSLEKSKLSQSETEENPIIADEGESEESSRLPFPIVGVGASAGGLEAFTALLQHLPADTGMAFVLIQHLSPTHKSMLVSLLEKKCAMPVIEVSDGLSVAPNHVYIIPPNKCMSIANGALQLDPRPVDTQQNLPIDFFLSSLAEHQKHKAIAVILSGTASDGSQGIKVVKDHGGITFAQDEQTAQFGMMPQNAIATGYIDFVLSPENIAKELIGLSHHPYIDQRETNKEGSGSQTDNLPQILMLLQKASGIDFKNYKIPTIQRRILRRMMLNKIENYKDYVAYLISNPKELQTLSQDIFITVTRFFRDPESFKALKQDVFPNLVANRSSEPIRVWILGCSTGEEVYSLAITYLEFMEGKESHRINFFATDIKDSSIESARQGIYPENIINDVSGERLKKFFIKTNNGYQVKKSIRDMCIFARQNITSDPPFSKLDLISCRNLLIYLNTSSQKKIIPIFHYALNPTGFLFLGASESVSSFSNLFNPVNKKAKIYAKNPNQKTPQLSLGGPRALSPERAEIQKPDVRLQAGPAGVADIQREADRVILKRQHHCGVVINDAMDVVQFRGDTSRYLKHLSGTASLNILKMAQEGLFSELHDMIQKTQENIPFKTKSVRIKNNDSYIDVSLEIIPFKVPSKSGRYFLIVFEEQVSPVSSQTEPKIDGKALGISGSDSRLRDLEEELDSVRMHLQGTIDAKEFANEELQAANEEILSANEELQSLNEEFHSANEELESAKEELQATNEEITTLNDELQKRNIELTELSDDQINLMNSTHLPIIMVGRDLKIRRFTPVAEKVLRLIQSDVGRPISDLKSNVELPDLELLILQVINTGTLKEQEVQDQKGQWYKIQILPYKTSEDTINGAIITFSDISGFKKAQELLQKYATYRDAIIQTVHHPLLILDAVLRVKMANQSFYDIFGLRSEDIQGKLIFDFGNGQWNIPEFRKLLEDILPQKSAFSNFRLEHNFPHIGCKTLLLNARQIVHEDDGKESILLAIEDITELQKSKDQLEVYAAYKEAIIQTIHNPLLVLDSRLRVKFANRSFYGTFHMSAEQTENQFLYELGQGEWDIPNLRTLFDEILPKHKSINDYVIAQNFLVCGPKTLLLNARKIRGEEEEELILLTIEDVTARKQVENDIRRAAERFRFMAESMPQKVFTATTDGKKDYFNEQWNKYIGVSFQKKGANWSQFIHPEDRDETLRRWKHAMETGEPFEFENRFLRADGVYRWHLNRAHAMRDDKGHIIIWIGSNTDIDDQKSAEEKIKHYSQELLRSNRDLEQFAAIASHDLQEPLSIVSSYTEILRKKYKDKFDEAGQQFMANIVESVRGMQELIRDLLSYSTVERENKFKEVDMTDVCNKVLKNLARKIKESGAKITCDQLPRMLVNETLITQLSQNLINNAIKFRNPQVTPEIHISAKSGEDSWIFSVKDNGIGIAVEHQDQIFEIFRKLHSKNEYSGTGIGLALCKRIVEFHDGKIWVESEHGKGTTFYISLPKERMGVNVGGK